MKKYLILYDISCNKTRNFFVKKLKRYGFYRLQKSVFLGYTNKEKLKKLEVTIEKTFKKSTTDSYIILPVSEYEIKNIKYWGEQINMDLYLGRINVVFI
ncbi:MAG: hypothetical protein Kow0079_12900 [Vicingaceae bacterium]